ncbi:kinase-like domain-containing protein, partial [Peziza echinospora]
RRLGSHPNIAQFKSSSASGILLKYYPHGALRNYLTSSASSLTLSTRLNILRQLSCALIHLHSLNVIHCNLRTNNILLSQDDPINLVIADFVGSSIDKSSPLIACDSCSSRPDIDFEHPVFQDDLFAFASIVWEIFDCQKPFQNEPTSEVYRLFKERQFPSFTSHENRPTAIERFIH